MTKTTYKIEVCIDNYNDALKAINSGAHQLEVCSHLDLDGLTPDIELVEKLLSFADKELKVMIRPRGGNFIYTSEEKMVMRQEVELFSDLGITHFVAGMLLQDNTIDIQGMQNLTENIESEFTFHKAIDSVEHILDQLELLSAIEKVKYILTSGGEVTATEGKDVLKKMVDEYKSRFKIIPAGKITDENLTHIHAYIGAEYYHGRKILG